MKQSILDAIKQFETIIIHRHVRPDPDAYGSQGGLAEIIKTSFPAKKVYTVGKEEESLHFLRRLDVIEDSMYENALVIVCDTANQERVCDSRYTKGRMLIKIDHHPNDDPYGDIVWVDTSASSVSEMIYEFYLFGKDQGLKLNDEGARLLYAGIVGDTGRFLYPSTTEKTFSYAGELINYNFTRPDMYNQMYELEPNIVKLNGYVLQNFTMLPSGAAYMKLDKEVLSRFEAVPSQASLLVGELGSVKGITAWVFFIEEDDQIRVRFRSKGPIINVLAKKYNGGGHPLASGASIFSWDVAQDVIRDLDELCK
ncbi:MULTISPECIES: bifunctional oligoribonuclease/PAP phosphatase NrnA [Bacillaceae]|uniref:DHH family phosphoesterase n=1 Tax=Bacillaceae TaxID=186817 RepID=UPI001E65D0B8|nr:MULTISPECIES: bifunctional oligoribonuclease/PAP phosphatase NrnA [Bacillaceae]MCE4051183.1 bifunctional oligoribonuclease/PAP phosphatase NrnA [Bacillus sp. Au-Bac7]MCM3029860.1 bifunctional oligoribonuclease/PAP phosphatase NrnA [Niallia sp. MER 6]MDL0436673.1 bifunctional oligoribonuclease/PAP phosphatase NrnA [Niallia sp. SS-2023]UPO86846.1 bifunctional oligoribonuclease/PAP phosphatase NrnA [Niallia sp. Man26]